ncbi:ETX/MTX2 family pore-forming toxin [Bacillus cereus]|uniref:ETX/MTX2 family pore-forming toxin n=2 Tax=Bacillus cereus TaxID=1396 RepID=UPI001F603225|nr:ETX/MTX2 family pore-forming toxin [Bacillus cereus]
MAEQPLVYADKISSIDRKENTNIGIENWEDYIYHATETFGKNLYNPNGEYKYTTSDGKDLGYFDVTYHQFSVEAVDSPFITNPENIFVGKTTLTNNTDQEQTLSTNSFSKMISNSVSYATTHGYKFGTKASGKLGIPLIGETGMELSAEYNFSDTDNRTNSENFTYTVSPQNIKVPANSSVEVIVQLDSVTAKGNVKLITNMSGRDEGTFEYTNTAAFYQQNFNQIVLYASNFEDFPYISANPDGKTINLIGSGKYEAKYGTEFSVTVKPIKHRDTREIDKGYTYKVKPFITKEN